MIKENKKKLCLILLGLLLLAGWFYWFQWRPTKIRSYCHNRANEKATLTSKKSDLLDALYPPEESENKISTKDYIFLYDACLHQKGLR
ncbi:unnamed protein product [marine sediment metagenome]|uniref:Uncharacterized protein n=1 Tax=marine sediment metagenome TaxID=412755 RepID=X0WX87_9ZZZZ